MTENLIRALKADLADPSEFESLLLSHFGHARTSDDVVAFQRRSLDGQLSEDTLRVRLSTSRRTFGTVREIERGPAFDETDVAQIASKVESHLLSDGRRTILRSVLFSFIPCVGAYRFKDEFQILPAPADWKRPPNIVLDHQPFILEASFQGSDDHSVRGARMRRREREIELLLALLLTPSVFAISRSVRSHWVYLRDFEGSEFLQEGYLVPGGLPQTDEFTSAAGIPQLETVDPAEYYGQHGFGIGDTLRIPASLTTSLAQAEVLAGEDRERFLRACYWYQQSEKLRYYSRSVSFVALVSAIESLIPPESGERCEACGRDKSPGPTQRFSNFVDKHLPAAVPEAARKGFYAMRSALAHGGKLLHADEGNWGFGFAGVGERVQLDTLSRLTRLVLLIWLESSKEPV
jgi:hypothetical protein